MRDRLSNTVGQIAAFPVGGKRMTLVWRSTISSLLIVFLFVPNLGGSQEDARIKLIHTISGNTLKIIRAAMTKFEKHDLPLEECLVTVVEDGPFFVVIFDDPNRPPNLSGRAPNFPTFEVELSKSSLEVTRAYYAR